MVGLGKVVSLLRGDKLDAPLCASLDKQGDVCGVGIPEKPVN